MFKNIHLPLALFSLGLCHVAFAQNFHSFTVDNAANGASCAQIINLDHDSDNDIVAANKTSNEIAWYDNDGSENFTKHIIASGYNGASGAYATDMDGDNDMDIVGCASAANKISWWENDSFQNFSRHDIDSSFAGASVAIPIDIDYDNDMDIIGCSETGGILAVWNNDGNQNFTKATIATGLGNITAVYPINLDADSDLDIVATVSSTNQTRWFQNNAGVFSSILIDNTIAGVQAVFAKNLDGDADVDVVAIGTGEVAWFENNGSQVLTKHILDQNLTSGSDIYIDDFDDDGDEDILGAAGNGLIIWENDGVANFYGWTVSNSVGEAHIQTGNVNADGNKDFITASYTGNKIQWWRHELLDETLNAANWNIQPVYAGVEWKSYLFDSLFNSRQSINVIDIDLNTAPVDVVFDGVSTGFNKTSAFGAANNAIAAVNGNFFNTSTGGSVNYITRNYALINNGTNFLNTPRNEAALAVADDETVEIESVPPGGNWASAPQEKFMISCGPRLLQSDTIRPNATESSVDAGFNEMRHPRTFAGITADKHLLLFTIDGRAAQAAGMSLLELSKIARTFHCTDAFNLDGGGSTTMWVNGQPYDGVVNYPSDNQVFDHYGERACANAILILPNNSHSSTVGLCSNDSILFNGNYLTQKGTYSDTINTNNKFGQDSIITLDLQVAAPVNTPAILQSGNALASSISGTNYYWYLNGNLLPQHDSVVTPASGGSFVLIVEVNGCMSDSSSVYSFTLNSFNEIPAATVFLFQNPADNRLIVTGLSSQAGENLNIYSLEGKLVKSVLIEGDEMNIDCSALTSGAYIVKIKDSVKKLIVNHAGL